MILSSGWSCQNWIVGHTAGVRQLLGGVFKKNIHMRIGINIILNINRIASFIFFMNELKRNTCIKPGICYSRKPCHSMMWLWTSRGKSGSSWPLLRRPCTGMWCWRTIATWCTWVRTVPWVLQRVPSQLPLFSQLLKLWNHCSALWQILIASSSSW